MALFRSPASHGPATPPCRLLAAEGAAAGVAGFVAFWITGGGVTPPLPIVTAAVLGGIVMAATGTLFEGARRDSTRAEAAELLGRWIVALGLLAALAYLTATIELFPRSWAVLWFVLGFAGLLATRRLAAGHIAAPDSTANARRIAVIGAGDKGAKLVWYLQSLAGQAYAVVGIYDDRHSRVPSDIAGVPVAGTTETLIEAARGGMIDLVIVALPGEATERLNTVLGALNELPVEIKFCPDTIGADLPMLGVDYIGGLGLLNVTPPRR